MKFTLKLVALALCIATIFCLVGCTGGKFTTTDKDADDSTQANIDPSVFQEPYKGDKNPVIEMSVKDYGIIKIELDPDVAPVTVNNFVKLTKDGFYDGLTFHRVYKGFMIQGGAPNGDGTGGSSQDILGEFSLNGVNNTLSHKRGVISMARSQRYNSASSQFFIVHEDSNSLDGQYAAFGEVVEGMDVVDAIANSDVRMNASGEPSDPINTITIEYVKVISE